MMNKLVVILLALALFTPMSAAHAAIDPALVEHGPMAADHLPTCDEDAGGAHDHGDETVDQIALCKCATVLCAAPAVVAQPNGAGIRINFVTVRFQVPSSAPGSGLAFAAEPPPPRV